MSIEMKPLALPTTDVEENSVMNTLKFAVSFSVGEKKIVTDAFAELHSGECLAIMGPSGAGKTSLLNVLTLAAYGGKSVGEVTLNGNAMTSDLFRKTCCVVNQEDYHWSYLTCRETITYAADLYLKLTPAETERKVNEMLENTGLNSCADTVVGNAFMKGLSGGQKRRLSVAVALMKNLDVIYLDEPTSGLDSASAAAIMTFIADITKRHKLISITTIHQPSTAVYNGFDRVMLLSKGRMAYCGVAGDEVLSYFDSIGHPIGLNMNPAEFMVDLVNADFNDAAVVDGVLNAWSGRKHLTGPYNASSVQVVVTNKEKKASLESEESSFFKQFSVLLGRHYTLSLRDPMLFIGRMGIFLVATVFFAIIYVNARDPEQDQIVNRMWYINWCIGMPANMGVIAVYAYNNEFHAIKREAKNGMVSPGAYLLAMSCLQIPVMFALAVCAMSVGCYGIIDFEPSHYGQVILIYAACIYCFEGFAQLFSVLNENPLMGMMNFMQTWFGSFLFCGMLIPLSDVIWPFKVFGYVMPLKYAIRSIVYQEFIDQDWKGAELCDPNPTSRFCHYHDGRTGPMDGWTCGETQELCYGKEGWQVLDQIGKSFAMVSSENTTGMDILYLVAITVALKVIQAYLAIDKCKASSTIVKP